MNERELIVDRMIERMFRAGCSTREVTLAVSLLATVKDDADAAIKAHMVATLVERKLAGLSERTSVAASVN